MLKPFIHLFGYLFVTLSTAAAIAQGTPAGTAPVAYVYVSSEGSDGNPDNIVAFAASRDGKLAPVAGSPFPAHVFSMAVNGKYLFGEEEDEIHTYSFSIAADGSLKKVASTNDQQHNGGDCGGIGPLFLDHTGATLYGVDFDGVSCKSNIYVSYKVENPTGELQYLGKNGATSYFNSPLSFIGNNVYAYGASCVGDPQIYGFQRQSDGMLTLANVSGAVPVAPQGDSYCPTLTAADRTNHVAVFLQTLVAGAFDQGQLATYTADQFGNLTTNSTDANMPQTSLLTGYDMKMSPSGELLAVGGLAGLEVFHFNGSDPVTPYTGLLTNDYIQQLFWDNAHHLYAIAPGAGKLYVFTITPEDFSQAAGSPHAIADPVSIIVQPKTPQPTN